MAQRNFRLSDPLANRIVQVAEKQRYASTSAFIRAAIEEKLDSRRENGSEERIVPTLERLRQQLRRLGTALQAEFALVDALAPLPKMAPKIEVIGSTHCHSCSFGHCRRLGVGGRGVPTTTAAVPHVPTSNDSCWHVFSFVLKRSEVRRQRSATKS